MAAITNAPGAEVRIVESFPARRYQLWGKGDAARRVVLSEQSALAIILATMPRCQRDRQAPDPDQIERRSPWATACYQAPDGSLPTLGDNASPRPRPPRPRPAVRQPGRCGIRIVDRVYGSLP